MQNQRGMYRTRSQIEPVEWNNQRKDWIRPPLDRQVLKELSERRTINGVLRTLWFAALLGAAVVITRVLIDINPWLAIPGMHAYWFLYGFWVALAHELQHQTVFAKRRMPSRPVARPQRVAGPIPRRHDPAPEHDVREEITCTV